MIQSILHKLLHPIISWHEVYRAEIVAQWLKIHNPDMAEAVALLRESRSYRFVGTTPSKKKTARRRAFRKLQKVTSDTAIHAVIRKEFPPLPHTWD